VPPSKENILRQHKEDIFLETKVSTIGWIASKKKG
jgi:hypothetical protein